MSDRTIYIFAFDRLRINNGSVDMDIGARSLTIHAADILECSEKEKSVWLCRSYVRPPEWVDYLVESRS